MASVNRQIYYQSYEGLVASRSLTECVEPSAFESHCHRGYELIYFLQGEGKYIVEGVEYPLHPQSLLFIRPHQYHYGSPKVDHPYERVVIHFSPERVPPSLRESPLLALDGGNYFALKSMTNPTRVAFETLDNVIPLSHGGATSTPEAEAFLLATLAQILFLLTLESPLQGDSGDSDTVLRVIEYLNRHLCEEISLDEVAREFFISKYHLSRIFHAQTGASLFTYFNTKRMTLARQMLADGESATAVALKLGFRDYSTFYRSYRRITGESPVRQVEKGVT